MNATGNQFFALNMQSSLVCGWQVSLTLRCDTQFGWCLLLNTKLLAIDNHQHRRLNPQQPKFYCLLVLRYLDFC